MKQLTSLSVGIGGSFAGLEKTFTGAAGAVGSFASKVTSFGSSLLKFTGIGAAVEFGMEAVSKVGEKLKQGFELNETLEKSKLAFEALTGSGETAAALLNQLKTLTRSSPLNFGDLSNSTKTLLDAGVSADQITTTLKALGNISAASGVGIDVMANAIAKATDSGSVGFRELNGLLRNGIPITDELAKHFNTTKQQVVAMAKAGRISAKDLQAALLDLGNGRFGGLMDREANTVGGTFDRLGKAVSFSIADIVGSLAGVNIGGFADAIIAKINSVTTYITSYLPSIVNVVSRVMGQVWSITQTVWDSIYDFIAPIVSGIVNWISQNWQEMVDIEVTYFTALYDVASSIFSAVVDVVTTIWDSITSTWDWACNLILGQTIDASGSIGDTFTDMLNVIKTIVDGVATAFETLAYVIKNWKLVATIVIESYLLAFVQAFNEVEYVLTEVIPAVLEWFLTNWKDIFKTIENFTTAVFTNLASNIVSVMQNLKGLITGSISFGDLWKPLTDGFESTIKELPKIADRQKGALEQGLEIDLAADTAELGKGLATHLDEKSKQAKAISAGIKGAVQNGIDGIKPTLPKIDNPKIQPSLEPDKMELSIAPKIESPKLLKFGSAAMQLAIYRQPILAAAGLPTGGAASGSGLPAAAAIPSMVRAATPVSTPMPASVGGGDDIGKMAWAMQRSYQIFQKWDGNFPIQVASF